MGVLTTLHKFCVFPEKTEASLLEYTKYKMTRLLSGTTTCHIDLYPYLQGEHRLSPSFLVYMVHRVHQIKAGQLIGIRATVIGCSCQEWIRISPGCFPEETGQALPVVTNTYWQQIFHKTHKPACLSFLTSEKHSRLTFYTECYKIYTLAGCIWECPWLAPLTKFSVSQFYLILISWGHKGRCIPRCHFELHSVFKEAKIWLKIKRLALQSGESPFRGLCQFQRYLFFELRKLFIVYIFIFLLPMSSWCFSNFVYALPAEEHTRFECVIHIAVSFMC